MESLSVDVNTVQWLATAYMLGAAVMVPVSAFAYRRFPTKILFCITTLLLVIGSVIGALATNFTVLLIGRIVQALGTGMLIPVGMNVTLEIAPREKLGTYMGIMGAMTTLGPSISVISAGLLLSIGPWPVLLWVFAGLSALCFLMGLFLLPNVAKLTNPSLDVISVIFIGLALIGILYGISSIFGGMVIGAMIAATIGVVFLVLFIRRQGKIEQPLIEIKLLRIRPFALGVVLNMISLITIFAMNIIIPTYLQSALGISSFIASIALFPAILCSCILSPIAGRIYDRFGAKVLIPLGFACIWVFAALVSSFIGNGNIVMLALLYIPVIGGSALIIGPVQSFALSKLTYEMNPHGVTLMSTGFQIAGCIGSSLFVGVYSLSLGSSLTQGAAFAEASTFGFLIAGLLVSVFAFVGMILGFRIAKFERTSAHEAAALQESETDIKVGAQNATQEASITLASIMKRDVYSLPEAALVKDALELFTSKGISGAPIIGEGGKLAGFISDGDVLKHMANQIPAFRTVWSFIAEQDNREFSETINDILNLPVSAIATKSVISVDIDDELGAICRVLVDRKLKKAPVLSNGQMVGIINRSNITRYAVESYLHRT